MSPDSNQKELAEEMAALWRALKILKPQPVDNQIISQTSGGYSARTTDKVLSQSSPKTIDMNHKSVDWACYYDVEAVGNYNLYKWDDFSSHPDPLAFHSGNPNTSISSAAFGWNRWPWKLLRGFGYNGHYIPPLWVYV